ncbi:hypothetical protein AGMMS49983_02850 [Clostridia bacterium]|nr:hypothetical protein AGMMS49983_02850 [Clostridia bacterium]
MNPSTPRSFPIKRPQGFQLTMKTDITNLNKQPELRAHGDAYEHQRFPDPGGTQFLEMTEP